jgi:CRP-like cAMP-binding protein
MPAALSVIAVSASKSAIARDGCSLNSTAKPAATAQVVLQSPEFLMPTRTHPAAATQNPSRNQLLGALPTEEYSRLAPHLELVTLSLGEAVYEPGDTLRWAYFPTTAIVSLQYVMEDGSSSESASVGREGMVGISLFMGGDSTSSSAVVQTMGFAYRLPVAVLQAEFLRSGVMLRLLLRYTMALMSQIAQTAACNRHHSVEQQLCRWLLQAADRSPDSELVMTQELVASMLGVRREGVTEAAGKLKDAGFIQYRRGHITVLQRAGLENRACECYAVVKKEWSRLLSDVQHRQENTSAAA